MKRSGSIRPLVLNDREIAEVAPDLPEIIDIVEHTYRLSGQGGVDVPSKIGVHPDHPNSFLHAMPAWVPESRALGMKWVSYFPGSASRGLPDSTGIILLNDPEHGLPVAIMEGMWITYARTTASAIVMIRHLARKPPRQVALIGCGGLGGWMVRMLAAAVPSVERVFVSSRSERSRQAFCESMRGVARFELLPAATPYDAVVDADLIVSSIPPPEAPFIEADWLRPDALIVPLDYFHCYTAGAILALDAILTDDRSKIEPPARELVGPERNPPPIHDFAQALVGLSVVDRGIGDRVMAIPTGVASTDMTVAWEVFRRARERGMGTFVELTA